MNFYKHYIGDFQRDTSHLTMTQRGAYLALIQHYYATENCLPNDHQMLCRIAGAMTKIERDAVKVASGFFEEKPEGLWHKRIEAELEKTDGKRDVNKKIALEREAKKRAAKLARTDNDNTTNASRNKHEQTTKRAESVNESLHENSTIPEPEPEPDSRQKPFFDDSERVIDITSQEQQGITHSLTPVDVFPMRHDWLPSIEFEKNLPPWLNSSAEQSVRDLAEFCSYRITTGERYTQAQWEHKYLQNLEANQKHRGIA